MPHTHSGTKSQRPFRQPVIARSSKPALRAACPHPAVRRQGDLDRRSISTQRAYPHVPVEESGEALYSIQNALKLDLNSWSFSCSIDPSVRKQKTARKVADRLFRLYGNQNLDSSQSAAGAREEVKIPESFRDFQARWKSPALGLFLRAASSSTRFSPTNSAIEPLFVLG